MSNSQQATGTAKRFAFMALAVVGSLLFGLGIVGLVLGGAQALFFVPSPSVGIALLALGASFVGAGLVGLRSSMKESSSQYVQAAGVPLPPSVRAIEWLTLVASVCLAGYAVVSLVHPEGSKYPAAVNALFIVFGVVSIWRSAKNLRKGRFG